MPGRDWQWGMVSTCGSVNERELTLYFEGRSGINEQIRDILVVYITAECTYCTLVYVRYLILIH